MLVFLAGFHWVGIYLSAWNLLRAVTEHPRPGRVAVLATCQSLFHSSPWMILTAAFVLLQIRDESWAPWFYGGFGAGLGVMLFVALSAAAAVRRNARPA